MVAMKKAYELKVGSIIKQLSKRNIEGFYCDNKNDAVTTILNIMEEGKKVTWGGSVTLDEIGIKKILETKNYEVIDRDKYTGEEKAAKIKEAYFSDYYLTSSNALTLDGELVNIDGTGNRVSAISFGPNNVIIIVGINKIVSNVEGALSKIRNITAPTNSFRLNLNTPCVKTGICQDCLSEQCICSQILITRYNRIKNRIKVIIVGEYLGY